MMAGNIALAREEPTRAISLLMPSYACFSALVRSSSIFLTFLLVAVFSCGCGAFRIRGVELVVIVDVSESKEDNYKKSSESIIER